jgi:hypothetical protein
MMLLPKELITGTLYRLKELILMLGKMNLPISTTHHISLE